MYVEQGGELYGFCPGKATWDTEAVKLYEYMLLFTETGVPYQSGGLRDQPDWFVQNAAWFVPLYRQKMFFSRAKAVLGDGDSKRPTKNHGGPGNKGTR